MLRWWWNFDCKPHGDAKPNPQRDPKCGSCNICAMFFPTSAVIIQFFQSNHNSIQVNIWNGFSPSGVTQRTCAGFRRDYRMSVNFRPVSEVCNVCEAKILQNVLIFTAQRKVVNVVSIPNYNYIISQQGHVIISQKFPLAICVRRSVKSAFSLMMKIL